VYWIIKYYTNTRNCIVFNKVFKYYQLDICYNTVGEHWTTNIHCLMHYKPTTISPVYLSFSVHKI